MALGATGLIALAGLDPAAAGPVPVQDNPNVFGLREGYTPMVSNLVSMMDWMRGVVLGSVRGLSTSELDFLLDKEANSIGAMLMHLAATERFYQLNSMDGRRWGNWPSEDRRRFSVASGLGDNARAKIKGNPLSYYMDTLKEVREETLVRLKNLDDDWLLRTDPNFAWGPTNNYCKWFHVVEHESNHNGQIKLIKSRIS